MLHAHAAPRAEVVRLDAIVADVLEPDLPDDDVARVAS
jgi:hypothetical protein